MHLTGAGRQRPVGNKLLTLAAPAWLDGQPVTNNGDPPIVLTRFLRSKVDVAFALLRIVAGLMFSFHGVQKIFGVLSEFHPPVGSQLWIGGVIELVTGLAIAAGAFTTWAAFLASGTMAVAYVQFHWKLNGGAGFFPAVNKGELALLYSILFFFFACHGAGQWSVDGRRAGGIGLRR